MPSTTPAIIKSAEAEVRALVEALNLDEARREAAVARLTVIGRRAVAHLIAAFDRSTDRRVQRAILRVLESIGDDRALAVARRARASGGDLGVGAVAVLQGLLDRGSLAVQAEALDALVAIASASHGERRVRLAAAQVVAAVSRVIRPGRHADLDALVSPHEAVWADAADGHLPEDPETLRTAAAERAPEAPLAVVHRVLEVVRAHERSLISGANREAAVQAERWRSVRGALHQALAVRGSRIAVYDLRETIVAGAPLPPSFLAALHLVGDESCLEPLATAVIRSAPGDEWWRHQLTTAFRTIVRRERLTGRHSAVRRALAKCPHWRKGDSHQIDPRKRGQAPN